MMPIEAAVPFPEYLPDEVVAWARENRGLLEFLVEELLETGSWPALKDTTRKLAREGRPVPLERVLADMPRPLGFLDTGPERRIVLLLYGLRMTQAGQGLLTDFFAALCVARERYAEEGDSDPLLGRTDISQDAVRSEARVNALGEILIREAPFLGGGSGEGHEEWTREVTGNIVPYWGVADTEDYLRIRAEELQVVPQFGLNLSADPAPEDYVHDVFISHASEDKDAVARPLAKELTARGWSTWIDEVKLTVGDSLTRRIDQALVGSRFGIVVLSPAFFAKEWPQRELAGLAAREIDMGSKVILPVWHEVDHHFIVQHSPVLADRLGARTSAGLDKVADEICSALKDSGMQPTESPLASPVVRAVDSAGGGEASLFRIPVTAEEQATIIAEQPEWWEYRLYAGVLMGGRIELDDKWHDHELRLPGGPRYEPGAGAITDFLSREIGWISRQVGALDRIFDPDLLEQAFGMPGEVGDSERVIQIAKGVVQVYESMMDWAAALRNARVPSDYGELVELTARMADGPIRQIREFIQIAADQIARIPALVKQAAAEGATEQSPMTVDLTLQLELDQENQSKLHAVLQHLS
jgi:hypothetical protein